MTVTYPMATQQNLPAGDDRRSGRARPRMTPGRRAALVFGVPVCLALVAATALSFAADLGTTSYPLHYTFPASATRFAVSTAGGQLTLTQAAVNRATLTGTAQYSLLRPNPTATVSGSLASYDYHCRTFIGDCGLNATLTVPAGSAASMSTGGGNAAVTGTTGTISLNTGGGDLAVQNVSGRVTLTTGGGNITAGNATGPLALDTDGGNIQASAIRSAGVTASSGGGNITITFTAVPGNVVVSTAGGDITIVVPHGPTAYHVTATTDGGNVSDSKIPQDSSSAHVITATSGGGNITISEAAS